jgi:tRNA G18 (ribose-2'-O)-methylase SpoU
MAVIRISRFDDPRLEMYRSISDAELLRRRNVFVAEGRLVVSRLIASEHPISSVLVNEASFRALEEALRRLPSIVPVYVCDAGEFASLTGFNLHRGCLALAERPPRRTWPEIASCSSLVLVLEAVADADNVGSAFRNAAAFGAQGVLLSPTCCDPLYRKAVRTSMGAVMRVPYARSEDWPDPLRALKSDGFVLLALTPASDAIALPSMPLGRQHQKIALLIGSEGPGLTAETVQLADLRIRIPIEPGVDSLNLATATGIALYQLRAMSCER